MTHNALLEEQNMSFINWVTHKSIEKIKKKMKKNLINWQSYMILNNWFEWFFISSTWMIFFHWSDRPLYYQVGVVPDLQSIHESLHLTV